MIAQLDYKHGNLFSGIFRIHQPEIKTARNNFKYLSCTLLDRSGELRAYAWLNKYAGDSEITQMALVTAQGRLRWFGGRWIADLKQAFPFMGGLEQPLEMLPNSVCPCPSGLDRLENIFQSLKNVPLKNMLTSVINNDSIIFPFISLPASRQNHHAYPGGLLDHSLECAEFVAQYKQNTDNVGELATVAALLHDIGKVRTIGKGGAGTMIGRMLGHDLLTLELLAEPLSKLDQEWRDGGTALRYLLSWKLQSRFGNKPLMVISELVQAADRISSGNDNEKSLFMDKPIWRQHVSDENGRRAWRPRSIQF